MRVYVGQDDGFPSLHPHPCSVRCIWSEKTSIRPKRTCTWKRMASFVSQPNLITLDLIWSEHNITQPVLRQDMMPWFFRTLVQSQRYLILSKMSITAKCTCGQNRTTNYPLFFTLDQFSVYLIWWEQSIRYTEVHAHSQCNRLICGDLFSSHSTVCVYIKTILTCMYAFSLSRKKCWVTTLVL